jgi:hypothetical protein
VIHGTDFVAWVRPGLDDVLERLEKKFRLCLCTMGMSSYVDEVLAALDPVGEHFGNRIVTRSEIEDGVKVGAVFPSPLDDCSFFSTCAQRVPIQWGGTSEAVVLDDQCDSWEENAVVMRVPPFEPPAGFFLATVCANAADDLASLAKTLDTLKVEHDALGGSAAEFAEFVRTAQESRVSPMVK